MNASYDGNFSVHWLNNKELQFTIESERLMNEVNAKSQHDDFEVEHEDPEPADSHPG